MYVRFNVQFFCFGALFYRRSKQISVNWHEHVFELKKLRTFPNHSNNFSFSTYLTAVKHFFVWLLNHRDYLKVFPSKHFCFFSLHFSFRSLIKHDLFILMKVFVYFEIFFWLLNLISRRLLKLAPKYRQHISKYNFAFISLGIFLTHGTFFVYSARFVFILLVLVTCCLFETHIDLPFLSLCCYFNHLWYL